MKQSRVIHGRAPLCALLVCIAAVVPASAQDRGDTATYVLPYDVVVTAPRVLMPMKNVPFATTIVGSDLLRAIPRGIGLEEPLLLVPGVKVDNQANGSRVHLSIRGQGILSERGIRGIRMLLDGIPMNDPTGFAPDAYDIDYGLAERFEVLRGPAASLYGGSASGGVIAIRSRSFDGTPFAGELSGVGGSNGFWRTSLAAGGAAGDVSYLGSLSRAMGDGYRVHTHFQGDNAYAKLRFAPSASFEVTPLVGWSHACHENPEGVNLAQYNADPLQANPDAVPFNEYLSTDRVTAGLNGAWRFGPAHDLQFTAYAKRTAFVEANNHTFTHRDITTPGLSLQYNLHSGGGGALRNTVGLGADLQWQRIDEHRNANIYAVEDPAVLSRERIDQRGIGAFVVDRLEAGEAWTVVASLRYDAMHNELTDGMKNPVDLSGDADFTRATARLGATYALTGDITLFAGWGQGFLPPATEELAQNPDHFGGFNTHLVPATSNSIELGTRGRLLPSLGHELTLFYVTTDNDFDRYRITDSIRNQETFYRNIGSSRRLGMELAATWAVLRTLDLRAAYTLSQFTYTNSDPIRIMMDDTTVHKSIVDGNALPNCPAHQLSVDLEYRPLDFLRIGVTALAMSKTFIDGANIDAEAVPGYALFGARLACSLDVLGIPAEATVAVRNLADTKYVAFSEPDPGGNSYQPGSGREFFGGLRIAL
jgi:iron complex outermembrane receptor protein